MKYLVKLAIISAMTSVVFAGQLSEDDIESHKSKDGVMVVHFDLTRQGGLAAVQINNPTDTDFSWQTNDLEPVNKLGDVGEINDVVDMSDESHKALMYIHAHEKKEYRISFTCPSTRPIAFIWK